jgi:hypothetical protein
MTAGKRQSVLVIPLGGLVFRTCALLVLAALCASAEFRQTREVTSKAERRGNYPIPAFYRGFIYWSSLGPFDKTVELYGPDGNLRCAFETKTKASEGVAVDTDGTIAVAWGRWDSPENGIELRDQYGNFVKGIATGRYLPVHIAFDEDHSIWTFGVQYDADRRPAPDAMTVRKYDKGSGQEIGAYFSRSLFSPGLEPASMRWQWSGSMNVGKGRIGIWAVSGTVSNQTEWVELDLKGNVLGRWRVDRYPVTARFAMTSDGGVFFQMNEDQGRVYTLDRSSSSWKLVADAPTGRLEGADGNLLVFSDQNLGPVHLRWYETK